MKAFCDKRLAANVTANATKQDMTESRSRLHRITYPVCMVRLMCEADMCVW
jgi:hypothetical protein